MESVEANSSIGWDVLILRDVRGLAIDSERAVFDSVKLSVCQDHV